MSLPTRTLAQVITRAIAHFRTAFRGFPLGVKTFLGQFARAFALIFWALNKAVEDLDADIVPSPQMSPDVMGEWLDLGGLPDGAGGYGPLKPTVATGGQGNVTGTVGTVFANGLTLTAEDGNTSVELSGSVTIMGSGAFGSVVGTFVAVTPGTAGNLPAGTVLSWDSPPGGADPTVTLTSALEGAIDSEPAPDQFSRFRERMQRPPRGGKSEDIKIWVEEDAKIQGVVVPFDGVFVYPRRSGTGTADVVLTVPGSGQGRRPSSAQIAAAQSALDADRPVGAEQITAYAPYMPDGRGHDVVVAVTPASSSLDFDWDDTAVPGGYTVDVGGYSPGVSIRLTALAPQSLKDAASAYYNGTGPQPRLQVISTGSHVNQPVGVLKSATAITDSGGKSTILLDVLPAGWVAPSDGDKVHAYGPVVQAIAGAIYAIGDSIGPSRSSGFADPEASWDDVLAVSNVITAAETATAPDGTRLIFKIPVGDATIDGSVQDVTPTDAGLSSVETLYISTVAVRQA